MMGFVSVRQVFFVMTAVTLSPVISVLIAGMSFEIMGLDGGFADLTASTVIPFIVLPLAAIGVVSQTPIPEEHSARPIRWLRLGWFMLIVGVAGVAGFLGGFASLEHGLVAGARDAVAAVCLGVIVLYFLDSGWVLMASALYIAAFFMFGAQSDLAIAHAWVLPGQGIENVYANLLVVVLVVVSAVLVTRKQYPRGR